MKKNEKNSAQEDGLKRLYLMIVDQMKAGRDKDDVTENLVEMGIAKADAEKLVNMVVEDILNPPKKKK